VRRDEARLDPRSVLAAILRELHSEAALADFADAIDDLYAFQVRLGEDIGKVVIARRALVDLAPTDPQARRALTRILRSQLLLIQSARVAGSARETLAASWSASTPPPARPLDWRLVAGQVASVDPVRRVLVVGNLELHLPESITAATIEPGSHIRAECQERGNEIWVVTLRVSPTGFW